MNLAEIRWIDIPHHDDDRGALTVLEGASFPFDVRRIFYMHHVPPGIERGGHARPYTQQLLITVAGGFTLDVSDGTATKTFVLDDPNKGLYLPKMIWVRLHQFQPRTVILVLCDTLYDPRDEIKDFEEFRRRRR
jgi:dTDP-4-dehydrorhamnose 3,5-epimerase-like enzyme